MNNTQRHLLVLSAIAVGLLSLGCSSKTRKEAMPESSAAKLVDEAPGAMEAESVSLNRAVDSKMDSQNDGPRKSLAEKKKESSFDWGPRYVQLVEFCESQFSEPETGSQITLGLKSGNAVTGVLTRMTDKWVYLTIESGGTVKLSTDELSTAARCRLFKKDYVDYFANKRLEEEKSIFETTGKLPR